MSTDVTDEELAHYDGYDDGDLPSGALRDLKSLISEVRRRRAIKIPMMFCKGCSSQLEVSAARSPGSPGPDELLIVEASCDGCVRDAASYAGLGEDL